MRYLLLILLLPTLAMAGTTSITVNSTSYIRDIELRDTDDETLNDTADEWKSWGEATTILIQYNADDWAGNGIIWRDSFDVYGFATPITDSLFVWVSDVYTSGSVRSLPMLKPVQEGIANGQRNWHTPGSTWEHYRVPEFQFGSWSFPRRFSWLDSALIPPVKDQSDCGGCWTHSMISMLEAHWAVNGERYAREKGNEDSTGSDRSGSPEAQTVDDVDVLLSIVDQWYQLRLQAPKANLADTLTYAIIRFADDTGDVQISAKDDKIGFKVCYTNDNQDTYIDTLWHGTDDIDVTCLSATDTDLGMGGADDVYLNDDFPIILIRAADIQGDLWFADTMTGFTVLHSYSGHYTGPLFYVDAITKEANVGCFYVFKPWIEGTADSATATDGATWVYWDAANYYNWGAPGCSQIDHLDLSEQQIMTCAVHDSTGCDIGGSREDALDWAMMNTVAAEHDIPWLANDDYECDTSPDSAYQISWWWHIFDEVTNDTGAIYQANIDSIKAALLTHGPLSIGIEWNTGGDYATYTSGCLCDSTNARNHAVLLVGWDDSMSCAGDTGAWHIRNSWGEDWGEDGYAWVKYSVANIYDVYAISTDSFPRIWANLGCECGGAPLLDECDGDNYSNTPTCDNSTCDRQQNDNATDTVSVTDVGWHGFALDASLLTDRIKGNRGAWGYQLRIFDNGGDIIIHSSEGDSVPYFRTQLETATVMGNGTYGDLTIGN